MRQPQPLAWLPAPGLPETGDSEPGVVGGLRRGLRESVGRTAQVDALPALSRAWSTVIAEQVEAVDVWQAESVITLALAVALRQRLGGLVVYDANDIDSEAGRMARLPGPWKRLLRRHERRLARSADAVVTVSDPYAQVLARILGRPVDAVVRNAAVVEDGEARADAARTSGAATGSSSRARPARRTVASCCTRGRSCTAAACGSSSRPSRWSTMPISWWPASGRLRALPDASPRRSRIAVASTSWARSRRPRSPTGPRGADVAAMPVQPDTLNHRLNTPTKLYDAMGVGVPGRRQRPAGHRTDRHGDRLRRPLRSGRSGRHRAGHPLGHRRAVRGAPGPARCAACGRPGRATPGSTRPASCCASTTRWAPDGRCRVRQSPGAPDGRMRVLFLPDYAAANAYQRALAAELRALGVEVRADPTRRRRVLPVMEALRSHGRPDVIHVHWTEPYIAGADG